MRHRLSVLVLTIVVAGICSGQTAAGETEAGLPDMGVRVAVWGQVRNPGLYRLSGSPDILELISVAGGPTENADLARITLLRERDQTRQRLDLSRLSSRGQRLFLVTGDVVIVPSSFWSRVRQELPLLSTVAVVANVILTVTLVARR